MAGLTRKQRAEREAAKAAQEAVVAAGVTSSEAEIAAMVAEGACKAKDYIANHFYGVGIESVDGGYLVTQGEKAAIVSNKIALADIDIGLRNAGFVFK